MAISPKDLELTPEELAEVERLEALIDKELLDKFVPGKASVRVQLAEFFSMTPRLTNEIVRRYKAAGWKDINITIRYWQFDLQ